MSDAAQRFSLLLAIRALIGLALAPVVGGVVAMIIFTLYAPFVGGRSTSPEEILHSMSGAIYIGAALGAMIGIVPAILLGWPLHLLLLKRRATHVVVYLCLGGAVAVPAGFVGGALIGFGNVVSDPEVWLMLVVAGIAGGLVFWLIRQPQRDATRTQSASEPAP